MSGDIRCKVCGDRPPARGRTICETCKKQKQREGKSLGTVTINPKKQAKKEVLDFPEQKPNQLPATKADKLWWSKNEKMGAEWPTWEEEHANECATCHKAFKTNLRLLKTCENCATV